MRNLGEGVGFCIEYVTRRSVNSIERLVKVMNMLVRRGDEERGI